MLWVGKISVLRENQYDHFCGILLCFQKCSEAIICYINPFVPNAPFLYPLKTSEQHIFLMFSGGRVRVDWERMD